MSFAQSEYKKWLENSIVQANVIDIFDNLLTLSVEEGASDIHIEPFENFSRIRIRIDGVLYEIVQYPRNLHESVISKFKIESGQMRPDEKRLPQDARVSTITLTNKEIDLRASTLPTIWWEKLVMRIVDKSKETPKLTDLGIEWSNKDIIFRQIKRPNGIILTTWPTGSGKTSTLYAALDVINEPEVNIVTYEDPVENKMIGLSQSQVRSDIGFTFASGLRAALRQDPDIIMVWEIRDKETLDMAMEAAMTGHLVFSTIHTNSSSETITRVVNLGAKPYMISGTFNLVMAQRLTRRICDACVEVINSHETEAYHNAREVFVHLEKEFLKKELLARNITQVQWDDFMNKGNTYIWSGKDAQGGVCQKCGWSWYKWRVGIFEFMEYADDVKQMLIDGKTAFEVEKYALRKGMIDLERDALFKVIKWLMPLEEVYRLVTHKEI